MVSFFWWHEQVIHHLSNFQNSAKIHDNMKLKGPIIVQNLRTFLYLKLHRSLLLFCPLFLLLKCWQNHIVDIRTAAFSRGQEKAGINHIGKIKSLGLTQQINFKFTRVSCFPWVWASYMAFDLTKFWSLLILVSVNENSNCKWHLCARTCAAIRVRTVAGKMWERVCALNPPYYLQLKY